MILIIVLKTVITASVILYAPGLINKWRMNKVDYVLAVAVTAAALARILLL